MEVINDTTREPVNSILFLSSSYENNCMKFEPRSGQTNIGPGLDPLKVFLIIFEKKTFLGGGGGGVHNLT